MTKPFCKFCYNKGNKNYDTHWLNKSKESNEITCPYLLNIECHYCHNKGHTLSYCPTFKKKKLNNKNRIVDENSGFKKIVVKDYKTDKLSILKKDTTKIYLQFAGLEIEDDKVEDNQIQDNKIEDKVKINKISKKFDRLWSDMVDDDD